MYAHDQELIPLQTKQEMLLPETDYNKASKLMSVLGSLLESSLDSKKRQKYLTDICYVLIKQEPQTLRNTAKDMLQQLGKYIFMSNMLCIAIL